MASDTLYVGCAGWSLPKEHADRFPAKGTHLERYAAQLNCVEINSSFYRPHRKSTYERWRDSTPGHFRFAVKMPKEITHTRRLRETSDLLDPFLEQIAGLGNKLGPCLVQLPPSLPLDDRVASQFFAELRDRFPGTLVCEPRHPSWFEPRANALFHEFRIGRVAADPAVVPLAAEPGGWPEVVYFRLHGSPRMYYSPYDAVRLDSLAIRLNSLPESSVAWCIFDNTAAGAAADNALDVTARLTGGAS